jgi:hypothetical protein
MPHIDFRQALSSSSDPRDPSTPAGIDPTSPTLSHRQRQERLFAQSDRMSLLFALFVFSGGLFCAFYFFNGVELIRAVNALPRELLYPRPSAVTPATKIDMFHRGSDQKSRFAERFPDSSGRKTRPFGPSVGSSNLDPSANRTTPGASSSAPSVSFSPPSNPSLGGNALRSGATALSRTSTQAATKLAQAKVGDAKRTAIQLTRRAHTRFKSAKQRPANTKVPGARTTQEVQHISRLTRVRQDNAVRSTTNSAAGGLDRKGLGGFGRAGGVSGFGGRLPAGVPMSLPGGRH